MTSATAMVTGLHRGGIVPRMKLPLTLAWLLDEASTADSADRFLAALGARLIGDGLPLAGGALTLAAPHPMIASAETRLILESRFTLDALPEDQTQLLAELKFELVRSVAGEESQEAAG